MEVGHHDGRATKSCYVSWAVVPSPPTRCVEASTRKEKGRGRSFVSPHGDRECTLIICSEQDSKGIFIRLRTRYCASRKCEQGPEPRFRNRGRSLVCGTHFEICQPPFFFSKKKRLGGRCTLGEDDPDVQEGNLICSPVVDRPCGIRRTLDLTR